MVLFPPNTYVLSTGRVGLSGIGPLVSNQAPVPHGQTKKKKKKKKKNQGNHSCHLIGTLRNNSLFLLAIRRVLPIGARMCFQAALHVKRIHPATMSNTLE
jgi:hypothetical protein